MLNNNNLHISFVMNFPREVVCEIFSDLPPEEVLKLQRVSKAWYSAIQNEALWDRFAAARRLPKEKVSKQVVIKNLKAEKDLKSGFTEKALDNVQSDGEYNPINGILKLKNEKFIKKGRFIQVKKEMANIWLDEERLSGHSEDITFLAFSNGKLISGSNSEIVIWKKNEKGRWKEFQTIVGQIKDEGTTCSTLTGFSNDLIFILSDRQTLRILREENGVWEKVREIHFDEKQADIFVSENNLISVSGKRTIRLQNLQSGHVQEIHNLETFCIDVVCANEFLIGACLDGQIIIWKKGLDGLIKTQTLPSRVGKLYYKDGFLFGRDVHQPTYSVWHQNKYGNWVAIQLK